MFDFTDEIFFNMNTYIGALTSVILYLAFNIYRLYNLFINMQEQLLFISKEHLNLKITLQCMRTTQTTSSQSNPGVPPSP
jgi:hypothetical protein